MLISISRYGYSNESMGRDVHSSYNRYHYLSSCRYLVGCECSNEALALYHGYHAYAALAFVSVLAS